MYYFYNNFILSGLQHLIETAKRHSFAAINSFSSSLRWFNHRKGVTAICTRFRKIFVHFRHQSASVLSSATSLI
ncbi:MAG: hypothetical protein ACJAZY_001926 [Spirosomataceae bacterium]|jgi:hypothetical protein